MIIYGIIVSVALVVTYYTLFVDELEPIDVFKRAYDFFMGNKSIYINIVATYSCGSNST
ncbi:putative membrane protein [Methanosalsum natronophilum]|nr:putative membrane protein [Methanosalsum natronophilum]